MLSLKQWRLCQNLQLEMAAARSAGRMFQKMRSLDPNMVATLISACQGGEPIYRYDGKTESPFDGIVRKRAMKGRRLRTAMDDIERDLRQMGYGIVDTVGGYHEDEEGDVDEPSFLAAKRTNEPPEVLVSELSKLAAKYFQQGVIIKLPGDDEAYEYKPGEGNRYWYGLPAMKRGNPPYYTRLKKGADPKNRKLVYDKAFSRGSEPYDPETGEFPES